MQRPLGLGSPGFVATLRGAVGGLVTLAALGWAATAGAQDLPASEPPPFDAADADASRSWDAALRDGGTWTPHDAGAEASPLGTAFDGGVAETPPAPGDDAAPAEDDASETHGAADESTDDALRTVLAVLAILALAYLAGHPRIQDLEDRLGLSEVIAAGFPFFLLGAVAHHPAVDVLSDEALTDLQPLLELGLGFIGFLAGQQFELRAVERWPAGTGSLTSLLTLVPFVVIALVTGLVLYALDIPLTTSRLLRDAAMFGAAGCLAAPTATALLASLGLSEAAVTRIRAVAVLDDVAGIVLLTFLSAFYRPASSLVTWSLPGVGWLFMTLGMGLALGLLTYAALRTARTQSETMALLLGAIALSAGGAAFFSVSPIVICFISGLLLANLPGRYGQSLMVSLGRLERPVYLLFLLVAGALWRFDMWQGWLLLPVFVFARTVGRLVAAQVVRRRGMLATSRGEERRVVRAFVSAPIGALSIAIVVNVQTLYPGRAVPLMITAVVGGALASELLVQLSHRARRATGEAPSGLASDLPEGAPPPPPVGVNPTGPPSHQVGSASDLPEGAPPPPPVGVNPTGPPSHQVGSASDSEASS